MPVVTEEEKVSRQFPKPEDSAEYWEDEWVKRIGDGSQVTFYEQKRLRIIDFIKKFNLSNKSILDIGCGIGQFNLHFKWTDYTGVDLSVKAIEHGKEHCPDSNYHLIDINHFPEDRKYNVLTAWDSFEHIELTDNLANKLNRLTDDGSMILGNVPTMHFSEAEEHEHEMDCKILTDFLMKAGFKRIHTYTHYTLGSVMKLKGGKVVSKTPHYYPFLLFNARKGYV